MPCNFCSIEQRQEQWDYYLWRTGRSEQQRREAAARELMDQDALDVALLTPTIVDDQDILDAGLLPEPSNQ